MENESLKPQYFSRAYFNHLKRAVPARSALFKK